ncbi:hypothetical protein BASA60_001817 [Batrachochytrium salamandrivorans]|nr:hypothetical protein BASA60_001817 [Batrachochytrium salamandrivorans]
MGTIADWATRWEMSFGVAKCGIMHVAPIPAPLSRLRFCQLNSQSETAAAETADQTPITPSSHQSSPISPSSPLSIYSDISSTSNYHPSSPLSTSSSIYIPSSPVPQPALFPTLATPTQTQLTHPIQLHGVAYYGLELIGGNSTLARRLQATVNTGIRMILKAPLFTPIAPMLTDCGIISLDAHAILARRSKYAFERTFQVWGKSKLACSYVQANHASSAKFLRSPALSAGQAIGASLLSLARCGGLWDYPRALKAGLLHPTATDPTSWAVPAGVYSVTLNWTASPWPTWW